ncbi:MAG: hypothetical protein A2X94_08155 [Bdellovibrionales bacterium GWB1_55_8]|nr:MAG: hypothetical protein A2X94_08155 [Bdellovibrionales bacterium GWB1_55_8]
METAPLSAWIGFNIFVLLMLALDLGIFNRKAHEIRFKEAMGWTAVWISLALIFNIGLGHWYGHQKALEFLTGYLIEKSLSVDNIFIFLVIFSYFRVPPKYQHKVLFWGILGALLMRGAFIYAGVQMILRFHWIIYVFGGFLIFTGIKMFFHKEQELDPEKNLAVRLVRKILPVTMSGATDGKFLIRENGKWMATPLLLVLVLVETTDLIFAMDSIPAILAISQDSFIVYTSNVFAILGLRSLYFALAGLLQLFHYLHYGLSAVLIFVGAKMILADWVKIPTGIALSVVLGILLISVAASFAFPPKKDAPDSHET